MPPEFGAYGEHAQLTGEGCAHESPSWSPDGRALVWAQNCDGDWELFRVKPLRAMADVADCAREAAAKGYTAFKTNIIWPGNPARRITQGRTGPHDQLATRDIIDQRWFRSGPCGRRSARKSTSAST